MVLPNTTTQTSHALSIIAQGQVVGSINQWGPRQTRGIAELYEFGAVTSGAGGVSPEIGAPYEKVPNNVSGMSMSIQRYDVYTKQMEQAFGTPDLTMLSRQADPILVKEVWKTPGGTPDYSNLYLGSWFSDLGRTLSATADRVVNVSATLEYTRRVRVDS